MFAVTTAALLAATLSAASPVAVNAPIQLDIPETAVGASIVHDNSFASFSFEPAFWNEFFGNETTPNQLTVSLLERIIEHGGRPTIRPGGITMDSMIFNASSADVVRTTSATGGVYRTTVGPGYYRSWSNLPKGTRFVSTLNFGNNSLEIAKGLAVASVKYQGGKLLSFELGNEPTNYPKSRWNDSTANYVAQWKSFTSQIDSAVNALPASDNFTLGSERWFASSATTDQSGLEVRPAALIPAGINSNDQVSYYSIHSYPFSTCDPARAKLATIANILNHTELTEYADNEIYPSAKAALDAGSKWVIGEFNSISCSGNPNVSDTFAQAIWTIDSDLIYASRNASAVYLHQGATLALQSANQVNTPGANGTPGYSTYSIVYPTNSSLRGPACTLPSFLSQLFMAEAFAGGATQIRPLPTPAGVDKDYFASYAFYVNNTVKRLAILNSKPYYGNTTSDFSVTVDVSSCAGSATVKRLTAPQVNEKDNTKTTWAGQSFPQGVAIGKAVVEKSNGTVTVRGSQAVLVSFGES